MPTSSFFVAILFFPFVYHRKNVEFVPKSYLGISVCAQKQHRIFQDNKSSVFFVQVVKKHTFTSRILLSEKFWKKKEFPFFCLIFSPFHCSLYYDDDGCFSKFCDVFSQIFAIYSIFVWKITMSNMQFPANITFFLCLNIEMTQKAKTGKKLQQIRMHFLT